MVHPHVCENTQDNPMKYKSSFSTVYGRHECARQGKKKKGRVKELAKGKMASYWSTYKGWKINLKRKFTLRPRIQHRVPFENEKKKKKGKRLREKTYIKRKVQIYVCIYGENKNARERIRRKIGKVEKKRKSGGKKRGKRKKKLNERMKTDVTKCFFFAAFYFLFWCVCGGITGRVGNRKCAHSMAIIREQIKRKRLIGISRFGGSAIAVTNRSYAMYPPVPP